MESLLRPTKDNQILIDMVRTAAKALFLLTLVQILLREPRLGSYVRGFGGLGAGTACHVPLAKIKYDLLLDASIATAAIIVLS